MSYTFMKILKTPREANVCAVWEERADCSEEVQKDLLLEDQNKMAVRIPLYLFSHHRKIANLYKKWLRRLDGINKHREQYILAAAAARVEFDCIYYEKDIRKSKAMLIAKEQALLEFSLPPVYFPTSPDGVDYERYVLYPDSCLDYWHPYEKAAYPEYFAKREIRKQQYLEMWEKMHGPPKPDEYGTH